MSTGSSPILYLTGVGPAGPQGPGGTQGTPGLPGPTGSTLIQGNTGFGISGSSFAANEGKIYFYFGQNGISAIGLTVQLRTAVNTTYGTGTNELIFFNIKGSTLGSFSILGTTSTQTIKGDWLGTGPTYNYDIITFSNIIFNGISATETSDLITITGLTSTNLYNIIRGVSNNKLYVSPNNFWDPIKKELKLYLLNNREFDSSDTSTIFDNYRQNSIGTLASETAFSNMNISGYTSGLSFSKPLSTINGNTFQSALYLYSTTGSEITSGNIVYFRKYIEDPAGRTSLKGGSNSNYGCCIINDNYDCINYMGPVSCKTLGGHYIQGASCDGITYNKVGCCYYDYTSQGYTCINSYIKECRDYLGKPLVGPCNANSCLNEDPCECVP